MRVFTIRNFYVARSLPWPWVLLGFVLAGLTIFVVLPLAGLFVALALGIAAIGVVALLVGLPVYLLGWFLLSILLLPFGILKAIFWRRRARLNHND